MRTNRKAALAVAVAAAAALAGQAAHAATLTWNPTQTQPATGGTGAWDTTSNFWTADDGVSHVAWNNATPDAAIIGVWPGSNGGPGGTLTLSEAITTASLAFNADNYTIDLAGNNLTNNGAITFFATSPPAPPAGVTSNTTNITGNSSATYTIGNAGGYSGINLIGNMNVTYNGTGTWAPGGNNTFTGLLRLLQGTPRPEQNSAFGSASGQIRLEGSTSLQYNAPSGIFYNTYTRNLELTNTTHRVNASGAKNITLTGVVSGTGDMNVSVSQGNIILAGANTYSGATILSGAGGSITLAHNNALGLSPSISNAVASTIGIKGGVSIGQNANLVTPSISISGAQPVNGFGHIYSSDGNNTFDGLISPGSNIARVISVMANSSLTLNGVINGDAVAQTGTGLMKVGDGPLILTGASDYGQRNATSGNETEIRAGTLRLDFNGPASPVTDIVNNLNATNGNQVTYLVMAGGTLELKGKATLTNTQRFKNSSAANSFTIRPGDSAIVLTQNGAADVSLNTGRLPEANRQVGGVLDMTLPTTGVITFGTAAAGAVNNGVNDQILLSNGSAFATVGGNHWAAMNTTRQIVSGNSIIGFYTANTATTLSGNADISGTDTTLTGAGDANTTSLRFGETAARTIDATGQILTTGGILVTSNVGNNVTTITGGTLRGRDGTTTTLQDLPVIQNNTSNKVVISSSITNAPNAAATGFTKSGAGTLELTGTNSWTGVTHLNKGVLKLGSAGALPGGTDAAVGAGESGVTLKGGVLGLTSDFNRQLSPAGTIGVTTAAAGQIRWNDSGGFAAYGADRTVTIPVSDVDPTARNLRWGGTSTTATSTAAIGFVPSTASLILGATDADFTVTFANPITLGDGNTHGWQFQRMIEVRNGSATVDGRLSGVISSEYGIEKTGTGTLDLTAANTYQGGTTISGGTLLVNNISGSGTGTGFVNVNSGGTLGGAGTIAGSVSTVTVTSGGNVAPGNSIGTLTLGRLTLQSGSELEFELAAPGTGDLLNVTSASGLTLNGGSVELTDAGGLAAGTYTLIDYTTAFGGSLANLGTPTGPGGFTYALQDNVGSTTIELLVSAIGTESVWNKDDSVSNWSDSGSWTGGVPNSAGATATFGSIITADRTVNVDVPVTVGTMNFNDNNNYTLAGSGITMDVTSGSAAINVTNGSHVITSNVNLSDNTTVTVAAGQSIQLSNLAASSVNVTKAGAGDMSVNNVRTSGTLAVSGGRVASIAQANPYDVASEAGTSKVNSLNIAGGALVDLSNTKIITQDASMVATPVYDGVNDIYIYDGVHGLVQSGRNPATGTWDGTTGITTSQSDATTGILTSLAVGTGAELRGLGPTDTELFAGQTINGNSSVVMYTYGGDADMDGDLDGDDYFYLDSNVLQSETVFGWHQGDFNYDGRLNGDDYFILDSNILQAQSSGNVFWVRPPEFSSGSSGLTAVPEPATLSLLAAALLLTGRSRRRVLR